MQQSIRFKAIPANEDGVLRYTATNVDTNQDISFEEWIRLTSCAASSNLARELTAILKVSVSVRAWGSLFFGPLLCRCNDTKQWL